MLKSMLISLLIVGLLLVLYLRPWGRKNDEHPPTRQFLGQCTTVFSEKARPEKYCRCLWTRGVRNPGETLTSQAGREAAQACH